MKNMKKLVSVLLTLVMALALTIPAFAADHTYEVYQIFTGDVSGKVLSNVKWGLNGTGTQGEAVEQTVLDALAAVASSTSDTEKLAVINQYVNLANPIRTGSDTTYTGLDNGYYLVKDKDGTQNTVNGTYMLYAVKVVDGTLTFTPKTGTTTSEKKVKDTNDSTGETSGWQDSADYNIGDQVPFQLKATIAEDYANYKVYKLTFHDKEDAGLSFNEDSVKVYVDGALITTGYEVKTENLADGDTFEICFADLKLISSVQAGSEITVEYTSTLNNNAVVKNENTMHVTYSNNPNDAQGGENGETPADKVVVFTYKTIINKVTKNPDYDPAKDTEHTGTDSDGNAEYIPLQGAGFTLYKKNSSGDYVAIGSELTGVDMTTFTWSGLDDGDYKLVETTTPAGYNTIEPIEFTITAEHNIDSANPAIISLAGTTAGDTLTFTPNISAGSLTADVVNNAGALLPETGGIGTTIFYVLGSILVLGAGVLLVSKKRMSSGK